MHINYRWVEFNATETQSSHNAIKKSILRRKNCKIQYFLAASIRVFEQKENADTQTMMIRMDSEKKCKKSLF